MASIYEVIMCWYVYFPYTGELEVKIICLPRKQWIRIQVPLTLNPRMLLQTVLYCLLQVVEGYREKKKKKPNWILPIWVSQFLNRSLLPTRQRYVGGTWGQQQG